MMEATAHIARELGLPCQLSLESPMACGIGICFSCVKKIRDASGGGTTAAPAWKGRSSRPTTCSFSILSTLLMMCTP